MAKIDKIDEILKAVKFLKEQEEIGLAKAKNIIEEVKSFDYPEVSIADLLKKDEPQPEAKKCKCKCGCTIAIIVAIIVVAAVIYGLYRYFTPDYLDDFDDDFEDDDFEDDDFFEDEEDKKE